MGPTRRFPLDEPAAGPLRARSEPERATTTTVSPAQRWPVLARIAELNRSTSPAPTDDATPPRTTYRVDAPHAEAPTPTQVATNLAQAKPLAPTRVQTPKPTVAARKVTSRNDRVLRAAPLPIRFALEAWQWIQPHHKLIRLAAMVTLMSAGGMAMVMMMNGRFQKAEPTSAPAATAVDTTAAPELEIQHAELNPTLVPSAGPEAENDALEPTAAGPLPPVSKPLMAVETDEPTSTLPYPTTLRPEPLEPIVASDLLPQAQFNEPAVARLKGTVEEAQVR